MKTLAICAAALAASALSSSANAQEQQPITLKIGDSLPVEHYAMRFLVQPFMDEVTESTGGKVTFERYPAQQLGKAADILTILQAGVVDIGYSVPSYIAGNKMPHSEVAQLPGAFETSCQGTQAYWELARNGSIYEGDYKPNKTHLLLAMLTSPYIIMTRDKPLHTLEDFNGLKLRSTGVAQDLTARELGAIPTNIAAPDIYDAVSRGTVDGAFYAVESISAYSFSDVVKFSTEGLGFSAVPLTWSIRDQTWNQLTPDTQKLISEIADKHVQQACAKLDAFRQEAKADAESKGVKFSEFAPDERAKIEAVLGTVGEKWAKLMDERGKQGTQVRDDFRKLTGKK